jgi:hypothetical protein
VEYGAAIKIMLSKNIWSCYPRNDLENDLGSGYGRIQARCKDSVKVTVKFIKKGIYFQQTERGLSLE